MMTAKALLGTHTVLLLSLVLSVSTNPSAQAQVLIDEEFSFSSGLLTAPRWACDPPMPTGNEWFLGNDRQDFPIPLSVLLHLEIAGGAARLYSNTNNGYGGYEAFYREVQSPTGPPTSWCLTTTVKVDVSFSDRPVPQCRVQSAAPDPSATCSLFPVFDGVMTGWVTNSDRTLMLRDGFSSITSSYVLPDDGTWHVIELRTDSTGSELRGWPLGGSRPDSPNAVGAPLGGAYMVAFHGPNLRDYDYSIDRVLLEATPRFVRGDCNGDTSIDLGDVIFLLSSLFGTGVAPQCEDACDTADTGVLDLGSVIYLIDALFVDGPPPAAPYPDCGVDLTYADPLTCENYSGCP